MRHRIAMTTKEHRPPAHGPALRSEAAWVRWRVERPEQPARLTVAELDECRCPDLCDRDHANE